ncbi:50S ribosomal protein L6 [Tannockella kyphosi]|uniref:50S ribosomal protein L6 n=1 Tax=Tannockella kyphosi TaxID=2899121 RepID=UPI002013A209|nr:50S ribosomal protein L6 [Tannockella kyphosi]
MSRVGNKIISIPAGVTVEIAKDNTITVSGAKGTLVRQFSPVISFEKNDNEITVSRSTDQKTHKQLHGTSRANLANMIEGVSTGFTKTLDIVGIGYRAAMQGTKLVLNMGYSHPVEILGEEGVTITTPTQTQIVISGISKERVGHVAAIIREVRKPEPYKGKGIRYTDEKVIRKEGKTAGKK